MFKAEYITFRGASFWRGPENSRQSQFRDRDRILIFEARKFRRLQKGSRLGNFTFTIKLSLNSGDPNNLGMNRKNKWVPGSKWFYKWSKIAKSGILGFHGFSFINRAAPRWRRPKAHSITGPHANQNYAWCRLRKTPKKLHCMPEQPCSQRITTRIWNTGVKTGASHKGGNRKIRENTGNL